MDLSQTPTSTAQGEGGGKVRKTEQQGEKKQKTSQDFQDLTLTFKRKKI